MRCKELQAVLEEKGLGPLPLEAQEHLAECPNCQDFLADLSAIVAAARQFPPEVSPPDRVWISLHAQLAAEGIIREEAPVEPSKNLPWWQGLPQVFQPRFLASVGAGLLVVLASTYFAGRPGPGEVPHNSAPSQPQISETANSVAAAPAPPTPPAPAKTGSVIVHSTRAMVPAQHREVPEGLKSSPSENAFLGETAVVLDQAERDLRDRALTSNAMADASLRANLSTLDEFIAECKARLAQNPQDQLTREYLNVAYQQKAELLSAMMDSGRSEH
jgi:hypothetical protein